MLGDSPPRWSRRCSRTFSAVSVSAALLLSLSLCACYRTEIALGEALICSREGETQRVRIPYKVSGMGSAHYPGPRFEYERFDEFVLELDGDGEWGRVLERRLYDGTHRAAGTRGSMTREGDSVFISLETLHMKKLGSPGEWRPYAFNGEFRAVASDC